MNVKAIILLNNQLQRAYTVVDALERSSSSDGLTKALAGSAKSNLHSALLNVSDTLNRRVK